MGTIRSGRAISLGILLTFLVGCASNQSGDGTEDMAAAPVSEAPAMESQAVSEPAMPEPVAPRRPETRSGQLWEPSMTAGEAMAMVDSTFYFDFDQAIVKRAGHEALTKHADYLAANRDATVRLEGHADERGTREYNLALGERRANAVSAYLRARGASANQIEVISYGEEKPLAMGHDESSWARNRRVELIYK